MGNGVLIKNPPNIKAYRKEITGNLGAAGSADALYTLAQMLADTPATETNVIAILPEGVRPSTSWGEVTASIYYIYYHGQNWGIHNMSGTGGGFTADFIILYDTNKA